MPLQLFGVEKHRDARSLAVAAVVAAAGVAAAVAAAGVAAGVAAAVAAADLCARMCEDVRGCARKQDAQLVVS